MIYIGVEENKKEFIVTGECDCGYKAVAHLSKEGFKKLDNRTIRNSLQALGMQRDYVTDTLICPRCHSGELDR